MTEPLESSPRVLTGVLVFASVAVWVSAFLAQLSGALSPGVSGLALTAGVVAGALGVRPGAGSGTPDESKAGPLARLIAATKAVTLLEAFALGLFALVSIRQFGWLLFERGGLLETLLPNNYGDLPLHWTYVRYLAGGAPFWPENPIISGERLRYPFGVDLLTALFVSFGAGMRALLPAMGLVAAGLSAFALRRWGGALAVAGFLFSGGLAGFQVLWTGQLVDYQDAAKLL